MDVVNVLEDNGAVVSGRHFVYASGKHGDAYINLDLLFPDVALMARLCGELAKPFQGRVDVIAAPATGGIVLSVLTAQAMGELVGSPVPAVWADKTGDGGFAVERAGFVDLLRGRNVLVVEDLLTTGVSVAQVCRELERIGGKVVGVSAVCNRGAVTAATLGVPELVALATVTLTTYAADACPLCADGRPIVDDIGHGAGYRAAHPDYPGGFTSLLAAG